jgi:large subunit ribosomal protein L19
MTNQKINKRALIDELEQAQMREDLPQFSSGDSISVFLKITEGNKSRIQRLDGIVIKKTGKKISQAFTIRKESSGIGVEQTFSLHSPLIVKIEVQRKGKVRRNYLSYMRHRSGKSARIKNRK